MQLDLGLARRTYKTVEPIHLLVYFSPGGRDIYREIGLTSRSMQYFASRSAALGAASAELVAATFYNFNPELVAGAIPAAWDLATPDVVIAARLRVVDDGLRLALGDRVEAPEVLEAAELARRAADAACEHPEGRPLFAAHASIPWPDAPHLQLWHAQTLLREYRGDGHIAALLTAGIGPLDALILHRATGEPGTDMLKPLRAWGDDAWATGIRRAQARGWIARGDGLELTAAGHDLRQQVETTTDRLSVAAYAALGEDGCERLRKLARPLSRAVVDARLLVAADWDE